MSDEPAPRLARWEALWVRWKHAVALLSFAAGVASFLLIERSERVAQALVILLPLTWLLPLLEPYLRKLAERYPRLRVPPVVFGYAAQTVHQECLFFTLPFFFATTAWYSPQAGFTVALGLLALGSIVDPVYYSQVVQRRAMLWGYHALAGFVTVLTAAPMLWYLTTTQSLWLAFAVLGLVSMPAWHAMLPPNPFRGPAAVMLGAALAWGGWEARVALPPATMWVAEMHITTTVDTAGRAPGADIDVLGAAELRENGLYAWSSIRVPRGLRERVEHHWIHEGRTIDVIPLDVRGVREAGYRAWSRKTVFPEDPRGRWQVRVVSAGGQLLGQARFEVR